MYSAVALFPCAAGERYNYWLGGVVTMTVQEIYRHSREHLSSSERLRLAAMILEDLARAEAVGARRPMAALIRTLPAGPRACSSWDEYERLLVEERDAWDR
jgi:hypothetical protein